MPPPLTPFAPENLPKKVQQLPTGRKRKTPVNLDECALKQLIQYACEVEQPSREIVCTPIVRLFRQCACGLTVETTAWEGKKT